VALTVRALWGAALVGAPAAVLERIGGPALPPIAVRVARVLGARHLLQCVIEAAGGRRAARFGVAVDLVHAASDLGFSTLDGRWRRAALTDAAVTFGFVVVGLPPGAFNRLLSAGTWLPVTDPRR
jgi:hypothetical protein